MAGLGRIGRLLAALLVVTGLASSAGRAAEPLPKALEGVTVTEHLGARVDTALRFTDAEGRVRALSDFVRGDVPVLLTLNYYECEMLCGLQLNALKRALKELDWKAGENFRIVTVSVNPHEGPELARAKQAGFREAVGGPDVDWTFLVSPDDAVARLADEVGFGYRYDPRTGQYAHPAVLVFLSPDGKVSRYVYGLEFTARDLKFALIEAAAGRVGSPVEKIILSCFRFDETQGRYTPAAIGILRLGGGLTVAILAFAGLVAWRRERRAAGRGTPAGSGV